MVEERKAMLQQTQRLVSRTNELEAALESVLTPQLCAILTEDGRELGSVTGGHDQADLIVVGRIGFSVLKSALDALNGGV
jgi:hypothetical protein